ncbi:MAG: hypothetical protein K2X82_08505, partial [Gemmataceae bacterium]|nr:hypothetical protein [Gemmataceae bacterium]
AQNSLAAAGAAAAAAVGAPAGAAAIDFPLRDRATLDRLGKEWRERVANYSPWNDVFSVEQHESTLVIDVPYENRYLFLPYVLGVAWVDETTNRLKRINPIVHPYWSWMRANRISHVGVRYEGGKTFVAGLPNSPGTARYKLARFTIAFTGYPWQFYEDAEILRPEEEVYRNTYVSMTPSSQFLAAEGGKGILKYAYDNSGTGGPAGGAAGQSFRAPFGTIVSQIAYEFTWKWVPYEYIAVGFIPANLYAAQNKLNDALFLGQFARGTIRFDPPAIRIYPSPVRTAGVSSLLCDVTMRLAYFDPPRGIADGQPGRSVRGHNLMPWRENNLWYPAGRPDAAGTVTPASEPLFSYTDLNKVFVRPT